MSNTHSHEKRKWTRKPAGVTNYRNFFGYGSTRYFIYPDSGWDTKKWGAKPLLGTIWADSPFYAVREAYTKQLLPVNVTFGVVALTKQLEQ